MNLAKHWRDLKLMITTTRDYAKNDENNSEVRRKVYDYIIFALSK